MTDRGSRIGAERLRWKISNLLGQNEHWDRSARRIIGVTAAMFAEHLGQILEDTKSDSLSFHTLWMHMLRGSADLLGVDRIALICAEECLRGISISRELHKIRGYMGTRIQRECLCVLAKRKDPAWYSRNSRLIKRSKMRTVDRVFRDWASASGALFGVRHWSSSERRALSVFLVDQYAEISGTIGILHGEDGDDRVVATPTMTSWLSDLRERSIESAFYAVPLLEPAEKWPTEAMITAPVEISNPMVTPSSARSPGIPLDLSLPPVEDALNRLQATGFRVNSRVLEVFETFIQHGNSPAFDFYNPEKGRKLCMLALTAARTLRETPEFFYAHRADYRGRIYPAASSGLHWQGSHRVKGLLEFSQAVRIPRDHAARFARIGATLAGERGSHAELEKWVLTNLPMIREIARDPYSVRDWMRGGRDSFLFLSWCFDYADWLKNPQHESRLIASRDATQSGFQICALLARDPEAARLVNALPSDSPVDLYTLVLVELKRRLLDAEPTVKAKIALLALNRNAIKRLVIPIASSSSSPAVSRVIRKMFTFKQYEDHGSKALNRTARWVSHTVRDILEEMTPGSMRYLKWASEMASAAIEDRKGLRWTSPSGLPVLQYTWRRDYRKHATRALPANFVQSIDAALLAMVVNDAGAPMATAHDCYGVHVGSLERLESAIGKAYTDVFSNDLLLKLHTELASQMDDPGTLPDPFVVGDLDTALFAQSEYAFS